MGAKPGRNAVTNEIASGDHVEVTGGTHRGKSGTVSDRKLSQTGHATITVTQADGIRFKTLARNARRIDS